MIKKVLFQTIQFSLSRLLALSQNVKLFIDRTLSSATTLSHVKLGAMPMKGSSAFSKASALLELRHQIV